MNIDDLYIFLHSHISNNILYDIEFYIISIGFVINVYEINSSLKFILLEGICAPPDLPRPFEVIAIWILRIPGLSSVL